MNHRCCDEDYALPVWCGKVLGLYFLAIFQMTFVCSKSTEIAEKSVKYVQSEY